MIPPIRHHIPSASHAGYCPHAQYTDVLKSRGQGIVTYISNIPASCVQWSTHRQALWRGDFQPIVINHNLNARIVVAAMHYRVDNQLANGIRQNPRYVLPVHTLEPGTHMNVAQHILVELFDKLLPRRVITNVIGTPLSRANERNQHQCHGAHRQLQRLR